ncbi:hypothetical protein Emed_005862 [Eimeria media]
MAMASSEGAPASSPCPQGPGGPPGAPATAQAAALGMGQHLRLYGHLQHLQQLLQGAPASLLRPPLHHSGPPAIASPQATAASLLRLAEVRRLALALAGGRASPHHGSIVAPQDASFQVPQQQPLPHQPSQQQQQQQLQQEQQQPRQQPQQGSGITMHALRVMQALRLAARIGTSGAAQGGGSPSAPLGSLQSSQGPPRIPPQQSPSLRGPIGAAHASSIAAESLRLLQVLRRRRQAWGGAPDVGASSPGGPPSPAELPWHALVHAETGQAPPAPPPVSPLTSSPIRRVVKPRASEEEDGRGPPRGSATCAWAQPGPPAAGRGPSARGRPSIPRSSRRTAAGPPDPIGGPRKRRLQKSERYGKRASTSNAPSRQPSGPPPLGLGAPESPRPEASSSASSDSDADDCDGAACSEQLLSAAAAAVASIPALTAAELLRAPVLPLRIEGMHAVGAPQLQQGRRHLQRFECPLCAPSARAPEAYLKSYDHYLDYHWARRKYLGAFVCFPCRLVRCCGAASGIILASAFLLRLSFCCSCCAASPVAVAVLTVSSPSHPAAAQAAVLWCCCICCCRPCYCYFCWHSCDVVAVWFLLLQEHTASEKTEATPVAAEAASTVEATAADPKAASEAGEAGGPPAAGDAASADSGATGVAAAAAAAAGDGCSPVLKALRLRRAAVGVPEGSAAAAAGRGPSLSAGSWGEGGPLKGPLSSARSWGPQCPPVAHYHCPLCSFSDVSFSCIKAHAREAHPDTAADPRLAAAIRGLPSSSFDASADYWVELGASTEGAPLERPPGLPAAQEDHAEGGPPGALTARVVEAEGAQQKVIEGKEGGTQSESGPLSTSALCLGAPKGIASSTSGACTKEEAAEAQGVGPLENSASRAPSPSMGPPPAASRASGCKAATGGLKSCLGSSLRAAAAAAAAAAAGVAAATSVGQQAQQQPQRRVAFGPHVRVRLVDKELSVMEQLGAVMGPVFGTALEKAGGNRGLLKQSHIEEGPLDDSLEGPLQGPSEGSKVEGAPSLPPTYPLAADASSAVVTTTTAAAAAAATAADVLLEEVGVATRVLRPRRSRGAADEQRGGGPPGGAPMGLPSGATRGPPRKKQRQRAEEASREAGATCEVLTVRLSSSEDSDTDKQQQQRQQQQRQEQLQQQQQQEHRDGD